MELTTLSELQPGQEFKIWNGSHVACAFVGVTKTPTGRNSYNYLFNGKKCKDKAGLVVIVKGAKGYDGI